MPSVFRKNPNFERDLKNDGDYRGALYDAAQKVVDNAKAIAPTGESGDYKAGLKVIQDGDNVYASGTDWKSHFIEWGTSGPGVRTTPIFAPLRRGVHAAGLRLKESSK